MQVLYKSTRGKEQAVTASMAILKGLSEDGGLFHNMTNEPKPEMVASGLGEKWYIMEMDNKPYPCCRSTHCTIDGTLSLRRQGLRAEDVESIQVRTYLVGNKQCGMSEGSRNPKSRWMPSFPPPLPWLRRCCTGR